MPILPNVMPALEIGQSSSKVPTRRTWLELVSSTPKLETESPVFRVDCLSRTGNPSMIPTKNISVGQRIVFMLTWCQTGKTIELNML